MWLGTPHSSRLILQRVGNKSAILAWLSQLPVNSALWRWSGSECTESRPFSRAMKTTWSTKRNCWSVRITPLILLPWKRKIRANQVYKTLKICTVQSWHLLMMNGPIPQNSNSYNQIKNSNLTQCSKRATWKACRIPRQRVHRSKQDTGCNSIIYMSQLCWRKFICTFWAHHWFTGSFRCSHHFFMQVYQHKNQITVCVLYRNLVWSNGILLHL